MVLLPTPHRRRAPDDGHRWRGALLRFVLVYLTLYAFATQIAGGLFLLPGLQLPALGHVWPMREVTLWLGARVAGVRTPLLYTGNSGDTLFHWIQMAWLLVAAAAIAGLWTALARRDDLEGTPAAGWFRLFFRFALAAQMFYYGLAKVIPTQFQAPSLVTLVQPVGHLSLSDLLWTFIGASTPYQIFTGLAELAAGLLLVVPRTATLGALVALADMTQVFAFNMAYDFGLKQMSLHLLLMACVLIWPERRALWAVFVGGRAPTLTPAAVPFAWPARSALVAQLAVAMYLLVMFTSLSTRLWYAEGGGRERSPLYGIWDVEELSVDGAVIRPADADYDRRWRRVIFDAPATLVFQRLDDSFAHYGAAIDEGTRTIAVSKGASRTWAASFSFEREAPDRLVIAGTMDALRVRARLRRVELDTFRLLGSRFRWVRPPDPFAG